jgi:hypothetical protein
MVTRFAEASGWLRARLLGVSRARNGVDMLTALLTSTRESDQMTGTGSGGGGPT